MILEWKNSVLSPKKADFYDFECNLADFSQKKKEKNDFEW
jgi:hypothetical protein